MSTACRGYVQPSQLLRVLGQLGSADPDTLIAVIMDKARSIEQDADEVITQDEFFTDGLGEEMVLTFKEHGLQSKLKEVGVHFSSCAAKKRER